MTNLKLEPLKPLAHVFLEVFCYTLVSVFNDLEFGIEETLLEFHQVSNAEVTIVLIVLVHIEVINDVLELAVNFIRGAASNLCLAFFRTNEGLFIRNL